METYAVIGGGLAGLTAANALASQGKKVTLIEQSAHLGGRARTQHEAGFAINLGPHALYRAGRAARTFREWRIPFTGHVPATTSRAYFLRAGKRYPIITNLTGLLGTKMFSFREKIEVANLLRLFASAQAKPQETMNAWLDRHVSSPRVRDFAATAIRIATFSVDFDFLDAAAALTQVASALKENVLYLDDGWQTLVDGLERRARSLGVEIRCGQPVENLNSIDATGIVLAVAPAHVEKLTGIAIPAGHPLYMASLDLALEGGSEDEPNVAFPLDRPLYFSAHSFSARLAPKGGRMIHVSKYLGSKPQDAARVRTELEEFATLLLPRWRQQTKFVRFLPELGVTAMMPTSTPRPDANFLAGHRGFEHVSIAGDWVGPEGMLSDAAVASALRAAALIQHRKAAAA